MTYGSLRYLSINGNRGYEQSRRDDLESLGYMLIFLATGNVPWTKVEKMEMDIVKKYIFTYKIKQVISSKKLCQGLPKEMVEYLDYCKKLHFEQDPDYDYLKSLFFNILTSIKQRNDLFFSWISNEDIMRIKANIRNESKNKSITRKSVSPHIRLLNIIKSNLQNAKTNKIENVEKKK